MSRPTDAGITALYVVGSGPETKAGITALYTLGGIQMLGVGSACVHSLITMGGFEMAAKSKITSHHHHHHRHHHHHHNHHHLVLAQNPQC